jgi:hypothetical protein
LRVSQWTAGLVLSLSLVCGCSQQAAATDDLIHALSDAHSALASSILGVNLYAQHRSTRAATETLLDDMAKQIADAERSLEPVSVASEKTELERDAALAAVHDGTAALLTSRDQLEQRGAVGNMADLASAVHQVDDLLGQLRGSQ